MSWETKMVLAGILDPSLVNKHVLDHPVVMQRKAMAELIIRNQNKYKVIQKLKYIAELILSKVVDKNLCSLLSTYIIQKVKKGKRKLQILEKIEKEYCKGTVTEAKKLGISFNKLPFGTSIICDYHEHGKHLKKKIYQHNKDIGLHMSRSNRDVPRFRDVDVENWKKMPFNTLEVRFSNYG